MDDLIQEFLVESNENLDRVDSELVKPEIDPSSAELLASVFHGVHSIKGASKIPRVVRDVSVACGKQVRIGTEEKNTELDRTLLEAINGFLTLSSVTRSKGNPEPTLPLCSRLAQPSWFVLTSRTP